MIVIFGIALAIVIVIVVTWMLLTRRLREKYAALWLVIALAVLILGIFPQLLDGLTNLLGVQVPANLLFAMAIVLLLGVSLHLSWELSQAEDEIRRTAEEVAILRAQLETVDHRLDRLDGRGSGAPVSDDRA
ncbi:hypothetical protein CBF90_10130 [Microbacterium sp. AISO3]|jgi:hypothetical protein|uniref:DUF2304 domain-containing protein n=1 Tax=Microbacterium arborescens TaxID=33883 RepID=A0ABX2WJS6_9MICO|nr:MULTISPECIES: DUF2304 domain-containing protein [Microbacterium]OAZ42836.1 hypothetical protein A9Z40_15115 [Microbacterium arborescens]OWP21585.1 hypothetical protein CBF90_10130 [Microbacterium sp. AISO3]GAD35611.1 hypothetical protein MTS1_03457 [Microbacterium sp. TS-1]